MAIWFNILFTAYSQPICSIWLTKSQQSVQQFVFFFWAEHFFSVSESINKKITFIWCQFKIPIYFQFKRFYADGLHLFSNGLLSMKGEKLRFLYRRFSLRVSKFKAVDCPVSSHLKVFPWNIID